MLLFFNQLFNKQRKEAILLVNNHFKTLLCSFLVSLLVGTIASVAYATEAVSNSKAYGPISGYSYENYANMVVTNGIAGAFTHVTVTSGGNAPVGYIGAKARLYTASGSLVQDSQWSYNPVATSSWANSTNGTSTSGTYYSRGITSAFNGDGYDEVETYRTPNLTL